MIKKEIVLKYLKEWLDWLSQFKFSYRKGIVQAIYNKVESLPEHTCKWVLEMNTTPDSEATGFVYQYKTYCEKETHTVIQTFKSEFTYCPYCGGKIVFK